ncbi:SURF1 family protein [Aliidiomarina halalkaliphila]|uniref:SURF1-like protein n=1 Tax=Aliidiomarina halalkaliphila TaxID=2593535 RepID=A0A552X1S8_9GAMM|nr:SURF1 family protein [Aliidiomarina halalkaliphila]TRW49001.1 SURF1 family protein [Aliidiomarina halalkaliphila]
MTVLRVGSLLFRLHPGALLITLLAIAIMVKLGFWQIDRGQEKQMIIDRHAQAEELIQPNTEQLLALVDSPDTQITITATLDPQRYFLIDNQILHGRAGYHVIAFAQAPEFSPLVLPVNLGWVPAGVSRSELPDVALPEGHVVLNGHVRVPSERPFMLQDQIFDTTDAWPKRIQFPELDKLNSALDVNLAPIILLLDEENPLGFPREWPVVVMTPHRHYAYAVQWFGLAIAALVVFFVASRVRAQAKSYEE